MEKYKNLCQNLVSKILYFWPFQIDTQLFFLTIFLDGTTMSINELVRDIWMSNACVKLSRWQNCDAAAADHAAATLLTKTY